MEKLNKVIHDLEFLKKNHPFNPEYFCITNALEYLRNLSNNTAKWIIDQVEAVDSHNEIYHFDGDFATCSSCGNFVHRKNTSLSDDGYFPKYCDECGAKMYSNMNGDDTQ